MEMQATINCKTVLLNCYFARLVWMTGSQNISYFNKNIDKVSPNIGILIRLLDDHNQFRKKEETIALGLDWNWQVKLYSLTECNLQLGTKICLT